MSMVYPWSTDRSKPTPYKPTLHHPQYPLRTPGSPTLTHATVGPIPSPSEPASTHSLLTQDNILPLSVDHLAPSTPACLCPTLTHLLWASTPG